MTALDDLDAIARLDSLDVLGVAEGFGGKCRDGWEAGLSASDLPEGHGIDSVVIAGMGGSGSAGDIARAVAGPRLAAPMVVLKDYGPLPEWVGRNTLFVAVSYSGDTEETLAAIREAHGRGARLVAVASGGALEGDAREFGAAYIKIPSGLQPRSALGYLAMPVLGVLEAIGLVPDISADVDEALSILADLSDRCHRKTETSRNPAKGLAVELTGKIPVIYGAGEIGVTAARRFKTDVNEYAKCPAFYNEIPELDHNEIEGWQGVREGDRFALVMMVGGGEDEGLSHRIALTEQVLEAHLGPAHRIEGTGDATLARLLALVFVAQMTAIYTGLASGVDPGPVPVLQGFKKRLAELIEQGARP